MATATTTPASPKNDDSTSRSPWFKRLLIAGGVGVVLLGAIVAYLFLRPQPTAVAIDDAVLAAQTDGAATGDPVAFNGVWSVDQEVVAYDLATSSGTFLGFRIAEQLSSLGAITAVGRTPAVTGQVTIADSVLTDASFTADFSELRTDDKRRDSHARNATGPEGTFVLTAPVTLTTPTKVGQVVTVEAVGDLTINGVTNEVTVPLAFAYATNDVLVVSGSLEIAIADYEISKPTSSFTLSIGDLGTVEIQLYLTPAN